MTTSVTVLLSMLVVIAGVDSFYKRSNVKKFPIPAGDNPGKPLFLTPLIEAGKIGKAQRLAKVKPAIGDVLSYSGYLTTDKKCGNNLFFWFFPAEEGQWEDAPLVLWLNGGPGWSSMLGLFEELGPFNSFPDGLQARNYSWSVKNNLLFIDQPVGTGYSFTKKNCYANDQTDVGTNVYSAIVQFLELFPKLQNNNFFLTGESFAGHYIPAIGYTILQNNPSAKLKINLAGMMIGDGWTDPREQIDYADYLYQTGLIDDNQRDNMEYYQELFVQQVDNQQWSEAHDSWEELLSLFSEYARKNVSIYNWLPQPPDESNWVQFIQSTSTRKSIHVGSLEFDEMSQEAYDHLSNNMPQSVKPWVEELLEVYPIIFYFGQVDVICGYPMGVNFLSTLQWSGQEAYLNATRQQWVVDGSLAGYYRGSGRLYDVLVRGAGHMVPADQPAWAFALANSFISGDFPSQLSSKER